MNLIDAICVKCKRPYRRLTGGSQVCYACQDKEMVERTSVAERAEVFKRLREQDKALIAEAQQALDNQRQTI